VPRGCVAQAVRAWAGSENTRNVAIFAMVVVAKMSRIPTFNFDVAIVLDRFVFPEMRG
jgi:hypothetical protein